MWFMLIVMFFMAGIIVVLVNWVVGLLNQLEKAGQKSKEAEEPGQEEDALSRFFKKLEHSLTDAVPVEREKEIEFAHEYDGIRELDNSLPPWWKYLFYITIIFSIVYWYRYHISGSAPLSGEEYKREMAEAAIQKEAYLEKAANLVNESNVAALTSETDLSNGKKIYTTYCVPCHGAAGEGGVGPNMTDEYWIHGGGIKNIFKTIKYGVPTKGMISWQTQLRPKEMQEVASYIMTLQGTNPPNAKAPQGEKYIPENTAL
jgi:cytochrome c oxidase cbb3-type subunit 3